MFGITGWVEFVRGLAGERDAIILFQPEPGGNQLPKEALCFPGARR